MNFKFWTWREKRHANLINAENARNVAFITSLTEALRHTQIGVSANHHVTYAQRPPAPKPIRLTVVYVMIDGMEYKEFINITGGMPSYTQNIPHYIQTNSDRISGVRYEFGYEDGSRW